MWLRIYMARQAAALELGLPAEAEAVFAHADAMGKACPEAWPHFSAIILARYARQLAAAGKGAPALAMAERAVAESLDEDQDYARFICKEIRAAILGEELDYADAVEAIVPGSSSAVDEIQRMMARLDSGQHLAPSELSVIAHRLAKLHDTLADQPVYAQATLDLRVKLALSTCDRDLAYALRPEIASRADLSGRAGIEARALTLALDALAGDGLSATAVARLIEDAPSRVSGLEALLTNRVLFKLVADCPAEDVAEAYAAWLFHLARTLGEETDWGDRRRLMEDSKWWFPEVEMAAFAALSLAEIAEESELFLRLAIELFSAGHAVASRTDPSLQNAARLMLRTPTGRAAFDRLAEAVATQQPEQVAKAREAVLAGLHVEQGLPRPPGGSDDGAQPQILYVETHAFLPRDMSEIAVVDTLSGVPRHLSREETQPLRNLVDAVFDHGRLRFHKGSAATLGRMLVPHPSTMLPPAFGIRGSGLIHAIPFAALPAGDGTVVGNVAVPVLLTGPDSRLDTVTRPFIFGGRQALVVADPDYGDSGPTSLPGSRIEANAIVRCLDGLMDTTMLTGAAATRHALLSRLQSAPPALLHLAVHGVGTADDPAMAHLKLSVGGGGQGVVGFDDIALLDLSGVELVVLGACSTMRGRIRRGEGVLALAWAFRAAGARAVISTRWDVDDVASSLHWTAFYTELAAGGSVCSALRAGGKALRNTANFAAPRHWATYQVVV